MPELPEVETMRRAILPAVGGVIAEVFRPKSPYRPIDIKPSWSQLCKKIRGRTIRDVDRLGKRVVVRLDDHSSLVIQPKMAGVVIVGSPPTQQHVRMIVSLSDCRLPGFLYWDRRGLGSIHLLRPEQLEQALGRGRLGPDACSVNYSEFHSQFAIGRGEVKVALLDQKRLAGIGNMYASEILHRAAVHPQDKCCELTDDDWGRIFKAMQSILNEAIQLEGSTLNDGTYLKSLGTPGGYQARLQAYDRAGQDCLTCKRAKILRIRQAQRSTYFCPTCQPPAKKRTRGGIRS